MIVVQLQRYRASQHLCHAPLLELGSAVLSEKHCSQPFDIHWVFMYHCYVRDAYGAGL